MAKLILVVVSLFIFISYCRYLFIKEDEMNWADSLDAEALTETEEVKDIDLYGNHTGYMDFYFCNPTCVITMEGIVPETRCTELDNYTVYKL